MHGFDMCMVHRAESRAEERERARCLAWLEWFETEIERRVNSGMTFTITALVVEFKAGIESGQWPEEKGDGV